MQWLLEVYEKVTNTDTAPLTAAQNVVNTGLAYFRHADHSTPQVCGGVFCEGFGEIMSQKN